MSERAFVTTLATMLIVVAITALVLGIDNCNQKQNHEAEILKAVEQNAQELRLEYVRSCKLTPDLAEQMLPGSRPTVK